MSFEKNINTQHGAALPKHTHNTHRHTTHNPTTPHHQVHVAHLLLVRHARAHGVAHGARVKVARDGEALAGEDSGRGHGVEALRQLRVADGDAVEAGCKALC